MKMIVAVLATCALTQTALAKEGECRSIESTSTSDWSLRMVKWFVFIFQPPQSWSLANSRNWVARPAALGLLGVIRAICS